jgi:hypothetical protein
MGKSLIDIHGLKRSFDTRDLAESGRDILTGFVVSEDQDKLSAAQSMLNWVAPVGCARISRKTCRQYRNDPNRHCHYKSFEVVFATPHARPVSTPAPLLYVVIIFP